MKKKKRGTSSTIQLVTVFVIALVLLASFVGITLYIGSDTSSAFATEPWSDPFLVCSTQWRFAGEEENPTELVEALSATDLTVTRINIQSSRCNRSSAQYDATSISITIESTDQILADQEQIGFIIHEVLAAIKDTEISKNWGDTYMIGFQFTIDSQWRHRWSMDYFQAKRAVDAGLTGLELFGLGNFR